MRKVYTWLIPMVLMSFMLTGLHAQTPVAQYPFTGKANDITAFGNDASVNGAYLTNDRFNIANRAFGFDGEMSYIVAPNASHLQTPHVSVSFWIRVNDLPDQGEVFLLSHGGWQERWKISLPSHGKPVWTTNHTGGISDMDSGDGNALTEGQWNHLVMVHDGSKDYIYLNGVLAAEKDVVGDLNSTTYPFGMGYDPIGGGLFFNGVLDEVTIWDSALDASQVAALFDAESVQPSFPNGEVAHYSFNGNLLDESEYMNHAEGRLIEFIPDRFGFGDEAVHFPVDDATVTADHSYQLNSQAVSVAFWVNPSDLPGTGEYYIASHGGWQERWKISLPPHGKMVWTTNYAGGISDMDAGDGKELVPGVWTHAVFVHDGAKDRIYINGVLAAEKDVVGSLNETTHPLGIGYDPIDNANHFTGGSMDEFIIYNYALTDQEILDLYNEQNTAPIIPGDLVAEFDFSGDFEDDTQFDNDATSKGASLSHDRFGYANNAAYLDGTASVDVPNSVQYASDYTTVSFWVNLDELPGTGEVYLASHGGWQERWKISLPSHGKPVWTTNHTGGISDMDSGDGNALVPGTWTHVVMSHGPAQDKIYINGVLANSKDVGNPLNKTSHPFGIGYDPIDGVNYMKGHIDEVRLYNRDLTDQEVLDLYNDQNSPPIFVGNVVADYPFNGNGRDESAYNNHGRVNGATASRDRFGRANHALYFDGSDDVTAQNSRQLNTPHATVAFWVNVNTLPGTGESYLVSFGGWQERYKISLPTHGKPVWTTNHSNGISDMDSGDGNELVPGAWTHLAFVHDGTKDYIYMDGELAAEKDVVGDLDNTTHPLAFGYNVIDGGSYFDGVMDDVLIYNQALSAAEIAALYAEQSSAPVITDNEPPCAPLDLRGDVSFTNVTLSWTPAVDDDSGVAGYNVYIDGVLNQTTTETTVYLSELAALTTYVFGVSAVDSAGNESLISSISVMTGMDETPDTEAPSTPANLVVTAGSNSAVFSWDPSVDNVGVAGYVVFVDGNFIDSLAGDQTSIFIGGLDASTLYTFEVYAFDFAGNDSEIAFITESTTDPIDTGEPGLVAHYAFEGNADDSTPYNNHGTIGGNPVFEPVTNRPDASGMAIVFDGDADSVLAPNAVQLISDYATVGFWVRVDDQNLADAEAYIIDFGNWDERWKISLPQHLKIVWTTNSKNAQFDHFISDMDSGDGNELVLGFWWYVTMVHDGTDDIIYIDGQEVNRKPVNGTLNSTARPLGMGNNPDNGGQYFHGALDEVKIYNRALTSDEVLKLYEDGFVNVKDLQEVKKYVEIIYPNPTLNDVTIKHGFGATHDLVIRIFDQNGRQVEAHKVDAGDMDSGVISMDVANLQGGMYSLNFVLGGKNLGSIPFVKQ
jgi:hypothetical protein